MNNSNKSWFDLELPQSADYPRSLKLKWSAGFELCAWMFLGEDSHFCGYHSEAIEKCRVEKTGDQWCLRIGAGSINISPLEAARIVGAYRSLSIGPPPPVAPSLSTDHEVVSVVAPPDSEDEVSPVTVLDGTGTLVPYARTAARALTANEVY